MRHALFASLALMSLSVPAAAHEIWIERDATGPARIYLGEPAEPLPEGGDPEFAKLKAPKLVGHNAQIVRRADHLEVTAPASGDLRLVDDAVFEPWKNDAGAYEGAVFHARAGRQETKAVLDLEIVPVTADGDRFTVIHKGAPLPGATVNIINPDRWSKSFKADGQGVVAVPVEAAGRYILAVSHSVDGPATLGGQTVAKVHHVSTLTFTKP